MPFAISVTIERCGDGGTAPERLELDVVDVLGVVELDGDLHDVAADRVAHLADTVGVLDDADVARVVEVVHDLLGVQHVLLLSASGECSALAAPEPNICSYTGDIERSRSTMGGKTSRK